VYTHKRTYDIDISTWCLQQRCTVLFSDQWHK